MHASTLIADAAKLGVELLPGFGEIEGRIVRLDHTGLHASFDTVLANVTVLGAVLEGLGVSVDVSAATRAVKDEYPAAI
jgi:aspartate aminotransferase-like enzyme